MPSCGWETQLGALTGSLVPAHDRLLIDTLAYLTLGNVKKQVVNLNDPMIYDAIQ